MLKLLQIGAAHAMELPYVWGNLGGPKDPSLKLGGVKTAKAVSERVRTRWINFATQAKPMGPPGEPEWTPYQKTDRACLIIDKRDSVVHDIDAHIRVAWGSDVLNFR
jgi:para-nitrobenzyl esterase